MTTTLSIRLDSKLKKDSQEILRELGIDISSATKLFLTQVVARKMIPFEIRTVNGFTPEFERETLASLKHLKENRRDYKQYSFGRELLEDIIGKY